MNTELRIHESNNIIEIENTIPQPYKVDNNGIDKRIVKGRCPTWEHVTNVPCWIAGLKINKDENKPKYEYLVLFYDAFGNIEEALIDQRTLLTKKVVSVLQDKNANCIDTDARKLNEYFSKAIVQASQCVGGVY